MTERHIVNTKQATLLDLSIHGLGDWHTDIATLIVRLAEARAWLHQGHDPHGVATRAAAALPRLRELADELPALLDRVEQAAYHHGVDPGQVAA